MFHIYHTNIVYVITVIDIPKPRKTAPSNLIESCEQEPQQTTSLRRRLDRWYPPSSMDIGTNSDLSIHFSPTSTKQIEHRSILLPYIIHTCTACTIHTTPNTYHLCGVQLANRWNRIKSNEKKKIFPHHSTSSVSLQIVVFFMLQVSEFEIISTYCVVLMILYVFISTYFCIIK